MKKIVVGVDSSDCARAAALWAAKEALLHNAELVVVHAWRFPPPGLWLVDAVPREEIRLAAAGVLESVVGELTADTGIRPRSELVEEHPGSALLEQSKDADLVVVGSRGRGAFASLMLGSVSHYVVHHANCPVAVIRDHCD